MVQQHLHHDTVDALLLPGNALQVDVFDQSAFAQCFKKADFSYCIKRVWRAMALPKRAACSAFSQQPVRNKDDGFKHQVCAFTLASHTALADIRLAFRALA